MLRLPPQVLDVFPLAFAIRPGSRSLQQGFFLQQCGNLCLPPGQHLLPDGILIALGAGIIEDTTVQGIGQILLGYPMVGVGVGIEVACPVAKALGIPVAILEVVGYLGILPLHGGQGIEEGKGAVGFGGGGKVEGGVGQVVASLRQTNPVKGGGTRLHHGDGHGVCKSCVLAGGNQHTTEDKARIFSRRHHPCQPVQGRIWVPPPQTFDKGADDIVVVVTVSIVEHHLLLDAFLRRLPADEDFAPVGGAGRISLRLPVLRSGFHRQLQGVQKASGIAVGRVHQMLQRPLLKFHLPAAVAPLPVLQGGGGCLNQVVALQRQQLEDTTPAHQGLVYLKEGIFRGGSHQNDGSVFHPGQQGILLGTVPAVHLVHKEDGAAAVELVMLLCLGDGLPDVLHPGEDGVQGDKVALGVVGDNPCQGGLAGTWGAVEDDGGELVCGNGPSQQPPLAHNVLLSDVFVQAAGPHTGGKGLLCCLPVFKQVHGRWIGSW